MIADTLVKVFETVFDQKLLSSETCASELEIWDSLNHIKLVIAIENEFDVEISPEEVADLFSNFDKVLLFVEKKVQQ